jgi:hypothetical protein
MLTSSQCTLCQLDCESSKHAYFCCPKVAEIWNKLEMGDLISHVCAVENNGGAVLEALLRDKQASAPLTSELLRNDLLAVAVWYIWWERRQVTHGETIQSPQRTAQAILTLSLNYSRARKMKSGIDRHGWVKPREDYVKLNVDASFCADSGSGSTGAIIRDDTGRFIAASSCVYLLFLMHQRRKREPSGTVLFWLHRWGAIGLK